MARHRVRAATRKGEDREAHKIGSGVYSVAVDLGGRTDLPLPVFVTAPLVYIAEMLAAVVCERNKWQGVKRQDEVARYLMAGLQEYAVGLFESFDVEHFEAWTAAARGERVRLESGEAGAG